MTNPTISRIKHDLELINGGGGGSGMMDERLRNLEADVAVIKATMATKDDIHSLKDSFASITHESNDKISALHIKIAENQTSSIRWVVGTGIIVVSAISGLTISIANMLAKALGQ